MKRRKPKSTVQQNENKAVMAACRSSFIFLASLCIHQVCLENYLVLAQPLCHSADLPDALSHLPPPPIRTGIGSSQMTITTTSADSQKWFNQGLDALHAFWDIEALRAFRYASQLDPQAAMAHWGVAMSIPQGGSHELVRVRTEALKRAKQLSQSATSEEQLFIQATIARFGLDSAPDRKKYQSLLRKITRLYPRNEQAKLFLALSLISGYDHSGVPFPEQKESEEILEKLLRQSPKSAAAHHYWIHAVELSPTPERALRNAESLIEIAPNSAHLQHMPGHIHFLLGNYSQALSAFQSADAVDRKYMESENIAPVDNWNYVHNIEYVLSVLAEMGRYREGSKWVDILLNVLSNAKGRHAAANHKLAYDIPSAAIRFFVRVDKLDEARVFLNQAASYTTISAGAKDYYSIISLYLDTRIALERQQSKVRDLMESMDLAYAKFSRLVQEQKLDGAEIAFAKTAQEISQTMIYELRGRLELLSGNRQAGINWLEQAEAKEIALGYREPPAYFQPIAELLARTHISAQDTAAAEKAIERAWGRRKNSGHVLALKAELQRTNNPKLAIELYQQALASWEGADSDFAKAQEVQNKLEASSEAVNAN